METSSLIWILVFAVSAMLFFGTAIVIAIFGVRDLRDLLRRSAARK